MKTLKVLFSAVLMIAFLASCSKDNNGPGGDQVQDNLVGTWQVKDGEATVYSEGTIIYEGVITTQGTITFKNDNTGMADFSMTVVGETDDLKGPFTWEIDGFEVVVDKGTEDEIRWAIITDKDNLQQLQFTHEQEDDVEVEFLLNLVK